MASEPLTVTVVQDPDSDSDGWRKCRPGLRRAYTESMKRLSKRELEVGRMLYPVSETEAYAAERPRTRGDCAGGERPCPWVSCAYHMYLDVNPDTGSIKHNFPDREVWEMPETCALDIADRGGLTQEETGEALNLTRERIRQLETRALRELRRLAELMGIDADVSPDPEPASAVRVRRSIGATPPRMESHCVVPGGKPWGGDHGRFFLPVLPTVRGA